MADTFNLQILTFVFLRKFPQATASHKSIKSSRMKKEVQGVGFAPKDNQ